MAAVRQTAATSEPSLAAQEAAPVLLPCWYPPIMLAKRLCVRTRGCRVKQDLRPASRDA